jgi:YVTN family beta-propeller protein
MTRQRRNLCLQIAILAGCLLAALPASPAEDEYETFKLGVQTDGRIVVPTNQILKPAGIQANFPGRPVDMAFTSDGKSLIAKSMDELVFIDLATAAVKQRLRLPAFPAPSGKPDEKPDLDLWGFEFSFGKNPLKPGFSVVGLHVHGDRVYASDAHSQIRVAARRPDGEWRWQAPINLIPPRVGGFVHPAGMTPLSADEVFVAATRSNSVQLVNLATGLTEQTIQVGVAPYTICKGPKDRYYVSNWGGDPPAAGDPQAKTSDTPIRIDPGTGIANHGSVSVIAPFPGKWKQIKTIQVGLHPCGMVTCPKKRFLYVANANSDTVSVIDMHDDEVVETINCRPEGRLPFGSGCNALALSPDGSTLYVANGTNNCIAVVQLGARAAAASPSRPADSRLLGLIPTGWYPGAVTLSPDGKTLFVANIKGVGSVSAPRPAEKGKMSKDHLGTISIIDVPNEAQLARYTALVNGNNRLAYSMAGLEEPRPDAKPLPVPRRHGEPSVFEHVIYIIKENRTYDQVLGDMKEGNGDPRLVMFGEEVTPNHHALARQFTLLDNFYCSGVLSADGHSWINEAYVTDYLEKAFGGFTRSYPDDGSDPLAYPSSGFLWDNALAHKKTFRNYGEFTNPHFAPRGTTWTEMWDDYRNDTHHVPIKVKPNIKKLEPYTHPHYPWFPIIMPDVMRAKIFIEELKQFEEKGEMPQLIHLTLPCNHTMGLRPKFPTPRAMVADNDLALGRIVEAVSKSKFWANTCILVVEDDPQDGFDHVDAHRTVAMAISPYTKRKHVDHTNYNQTGMVKTIELMLGLPPMNQLDLSATPMVNCFQETADLTPFTAVPNRIKLDEINLDLDKLKGKLLHWAEKSMEIDLDDGDAADEDTFNRILWHATRGVDTPYPEEFAGKKE